MPLCLSIFFFCASCRFPKTGWHSVPRAWLHSTRCYAPVGSSVQAINTGCLLATHFLIFKSKILDDFRQLLSAGTASASVAPCLRRYRDLRTRAFPAGINCHSFQSTYRYFDDF